MPKDGFACDDASNNKNLISGQGADLQSAVGLGGGGARCAKRCRAIVDLPAAEGAEGTLPRGGAVLLGHLEILAQQIGG